jgi:hypothetical protein
MGGRRSTEREVLGGSATRENDELTGDGNARADFDAAVHEGDEEEPGKRSRERSEEVWRCR